MTSFRLNRVIPAGFSLIRQFGRAALLTDRQGQWRLMDGHRTERMQAREWISLFCHEALVNTNEVEFPDAPRPTSASRLVLRPPRTRELNEALRACNQLPMPQKTPSGGPEGV